MKRFKAFQLLVLLCALLARPGAAEDKPAAYPEWTFTGSIFILTTAEGANLPAAASEDNVPLLVRLHKDFFNFSQAKPKGEDIRFSSSAGAPLAYQIEEWDAVNGTASVWVRIPQIKGNARQELKLHWGNATAVSASDGAAVFNASNGYVSVWHMNDPVKDELGALESKDTGTTEVPGVIGKGRNFSGGKGIFCGDKITALPTGSQPHSSEAWFKAEQTNATILAWGNEKAQGKIVLQFASPPHVRTDCYFSNGNVNGASALAMSEWIHVVHTYTSDGARIYVNGRLDGAHLTKGSPLALKSPARLWIGGWHNNYTFKGAIDEVRVSNVARSADWVRLQYENQKPLQSLTGPVVQPGTAFTASKEKIAVLEGASETLTVAAGGAQKVYWTLLRDGKESLVAVDRFSFTFDAGRVSGDQSLTLLFKAIYPGDIMTRKITVQISESIQDPKVSLKAPASWDGRETIEIVPQISNLAEMQAKGAGALTYTWSVVDLAVTKEVAPGKLILKRAQNSGPLTVRVAVSNGGQPVVAEAVIQVDEPKKDAWVARVPANDEQPQDNQFYARNDSNEGTLYYNGTLGEAADSVFLKVTADGQPYKTEIGKLSPENAFVLSVKLKPGLVKYKAEFGAKTGDRETVLRTVNNLLCGDVFIIQGQSNAVSTDWGKGDFPETSEWIRSYGSTGGNPKSDGWGAAVRRGKDGNLAVGYWGFELAKRLVESQKVPICIMNGAVGGTRIDQHQRNAAEPEDHETIYGRLLRRVKQARLTHGVRGILWHQGENDQGSDGPTGGYGWENYRKFFIDLSAAWKQDFPNVQHYYAFQIWPKSCSMGINGSDNRLRDVQRNLQTAFSNLSIMSTLGIEPPGGCHYPAEGYAEIARLIFPLVEQHNYGKAPNASVTPPNLKAVYFASDKKEAITLEFDQPVKWDAALVSEFYLDGEKGKVASGSVTGNVVTLKLTAASQAKTITYLDSKDWSQARLLRGENGIAALTFCEVPIAPAKPTR